MKLHLCTVCKSKYPAKRAAYKECRPCYDTRMRKELLERIQIPHYIEERTNSVQEDE